MSGIEIEEPRRCCLSVPGSDPSKVKKAMASGVDEVVLDLEDAVAPQAKLAARSTVADTLAATEDVAGTRIAVRVNGPRTPWCHADVLACTAAGGADRSIVLPKVETAGDLEFIDRLLDGAEAESGRRSPVAVQALIETAHGLANLDAIVNASPRLDSVILGYADLSASLGRLPTARAETWGPVQHQVLVAARSAGIAAIDGPYLGVGVGDELTDAARRTADLGFDGKWAIHPRQIDAITSIFTPTDEDVEQALRVLDVLADGHDRNLGAVELDGRMIDEALALSARRIVARSRTERE